MAVRGKERLARTPSKNNLSGSLMCRAQTKAEGAAKRFRAMKGEQGSLAGLIAGARGAPVYYTRAG